MAVLLVITHVPLYSQISYCFCATESGIYAIHEPLNRQEQNRQELRVFNNSFSYIPWFDAATRSYYLFALKDQCYRIGVLDTTGYFNLPDNVNSFRENKTYKYTLQNSIDNDHWFTTILKLNESFVLPVKRNRFSGSTNHSSVTVQGYNFAGTYSQLKISCQFADTIIELEPKSFYEQSIPLKIDTMPTTLTLKCLIGNVGISELNFSTDIDPSHTSARVIASNQLTVQANHKQLYAITRDFRLVPAERTEQRQALYYIIDNGGIKTVLLKDVSAPDTTPVDNLVIYSPVFAGHIDKLLALITLLDPAASLKAVSVDRIFGWYSYGKATPAALKRYLLSVGARNVILVGDACLDQSADNDLIPAFTYNQQKYSSRIETDYPYCYNEYAGEPLFAIGRLPFRHPGELDLYIRKVQAWLHTSGQNFFILDDVGVLSDLRLDNNLITTTAFTYENVKMVNKLKPGLLQYTGHASYIKWSQRLLMDYSQLSSLINDGIYFKLIDLSCWTGTFANPYEDCLSEKLLKNENKGPVVVVASSGYTSINSYYDITNEWVHYFRQKMGIGNKLNEIR
jgi:hypothetical protein